MMAGGMRRSALVAALALAAPLMLAPLVLAPLVLVTPALAQTRSGAASWPINTYLTDVDMARADAAIARAADGPLGTTAGFYSAETGVNGTVTASDETHGRGRPTCRTFQVSAFLPPQYQS